jgi:hypothetical protein
LNSSFVRLWHFSDMPTAAKDVRCWGVAEVASARHDVCK